MEEQYDITDFFVSLIESHGSIDVAVAEFKRLVADDSDLKAKYRQWCEEMGTSERRGFADFAEDYLDEQHSTWNIFDEYDDDDN